MIVHTVIGILIILKKVFIDGSFRTLFSKHAFVVFVLGFFLLFVNLKSSEAVDKMSENIESVVSNISYQEKNEDDELEEIISLMEGTNFEEKILNGID